MAFEKLSQEGFIHEFVEVSNGPHPSKFCFVLGAGASKSSGIKMGQELVDLWEKELIERNHQDYTIWKEKLGITEENKYSFYSQYYERRYQKRPIDGLNFLEKMMEHVNPNVGYVVLSYLLTKTRHNVVITTNFDHLTEDAVNYYAQTLPLIIGHESLAHYISKQITRPTIIKIHRDLLFDPKNTTKDVENLHDAWKEALDRIFSEYHPVFIGYAGNDNSLMDYLLENNNQFNMGSWKYPYWLLYGSEVPNKKVNQLFEGAEGYFINCNGFDEVLCLLGAELGYIMPTEEVFLSDAKSRYRKLTDAFDNIISNKETEINDSSQVIKSETSLREEILQHAMQKIANQRDISPRYINAVDLHNQGKYKEAIKLQKELIQEQPENARYHDFFGTTLHELGMYKEAEAEKRKAIELEPENARYHNSLGVTLHEQGRYEEAKDEKRKAIELEPENALYHNSLGITLHKQGRYEEAKDEKRKAIELEPENARYHNSLGITLHEQGRYEEAKDEKRKAIELEPENARYHDNLGADLHKQGKYEEAEKECRKAIELEPENASYYANLGTTLYMQEKYKEAEGVNRKAIKLEPENASYYANLGMTLYMQEKYKEAEEVNRKAIKLEPENASHYANLGTTLYVQEKYKEAEEVRRRAIELEPENARYHDSLGVTLHMQEKYKEAEEESRKAVELEPENARYHDNLSTFLFKQEKYEEAKAESRRAIELEPGNTLYHYNLSAILYKQGEYQEAEAEKEKSLNKN